jgi:hypothetical protein
MSLRRWALIAGLTAGLGGMLSVAAVAASGSAALEMAKQRIESADFRAVGHFVRVDAGGKRTNYPMTLKGLWVNGALHLLCVISGPAEAREQILMVVRPDGQDSVEVAKPGDKAAHALPPAKWSDGVVGALSYDDLLEAHLFWANQTVTGPEKYGARECDVVKSVPGAADRTSYSEVKTWLDRTIGYPVHAEKTAKRGGAVKDFTYFGLRQTEGVWSASQVEVKMRGQAGQTLLVIDRGSPHAHLTAKDFSAAAMTSF